MHIQGNLQAVFDALYEMGMIEPVLDMDWSEAMAELKDDPALLAKIMEVVKANQHDTKKLIEELDKFDDRVLSFLAMEVAREYADFHARNEIH